MSEQIELEKAVRKLMGFKSVAETCLSCQHFKEDSSTDNFGPGDHCQLNPVVSFRVQPSNTCNKYSQK